jgi:hypothetical protein
MFCLTLIIHFFLYFIPNLATLSKSFSASIVCFVNHTESGSEIVFLFRVQVVPGENVDRKTRSPENFHDFFSTYRQILGYFLKIDVEIAFFHRLPDLLLINTLIFNSTLHNFDSRYSIVTV